MVRRSLHARAPDEVTSAEHYTRCDRLGLHYGHAFQVLRHIRVGAGEVLAEYRLPLRRLWIHVLLFPHKNDMFRR
ncbi:polyketide synthase-like dehydratase family protein [Actinocrispum wychmicini]|uniref:Polyketide synthase-like dehydratase family protein n=1 Tax=Actinocrispum wychmicini TaxID=1213861 RepID=A0A4R2JVK1_9PSEU|nr:polyketide synthase-like dehydratase family protein [Actinocrispum wychmicini]